MDLWIQPCAACADLYGQLAAINPHDELTLNGAGNVKDARIEARHLQALLRRICAHSHRAAGATNLDAPERGAALIHLRRRAGLRIVPSC